MEVFKVLFDAVVKILNIEITLFDYTFTFMQATIFFFIFELLIYFIRRATE